MRRPNIPRGTDVRPLLAMVRAGWLAAASYRISMVTSLLWLGLSMVPIFFITSALDPIMAKAIENEGGQYFAFLLAGNATIVLVLFAVNALPTALRSGINNGSLESMLYTPTPVPVLMAGMVSYSFLWNVARVAVLICAGWVLGARGSTGGLVPGGLILLLIVLVHLPFGLFEAAVVVAFRVRTPVATVVLTLSTLLGGVYFPTHVIPSWMGELSAFLPLTYGLRALRRVALDGAPLISVASDIAKLSAFMVILLAGSVAAFAWALRYARRSGTLGHY